jgi:hypothetical protein
MDEKVTRALHYFLQSARGLSQEQIIVEFLDAMINWGGVSEAGSVLINHPRLERLVLFNTDDFLFEKGFLDSTRQWKKQFTYHEGVAGRCFRTRTPINWSRGAGKDEEFSGTSPIENMICCPIQTLGAPFGVVCFHYNDPEKKFTESLKSDEFSALLIDARGLWPIAR